MGIIELSNILGIGKSTVSHLVRKGMPVNSVDAAQAWRERNAPPRARKKNAKPLPPKPLEKVQASSLPPPPPKTKLPKVTDQVPEDSSTPADDQNNDPRQSLRRARMAEMVGYNQLVQVQKNGGSVEDFRKANSIYIHSRNNRIKAEKDFRDWQRDQGILLFFDEARDLVSRPHVAARNIIESMPKTLAPRLQGQSQRAIEKTLADWADKLTEVIRQEI
jgi:hypothetical protein